MDKLQLNIMRKSVFVFVIGMIIVQILAGCDQGKKQEADTASVWKHTASGDFNVVLENVKNSLIADQFMITNEENLAQGLENNKSVFGEDKWNTIGFKDATAVHFCSLVFNHEVFNIKMEWSVLCPFKVVLYTMKTSPKDINIITLRPVYLLKNDPHPRAAEIARKIEKRIIDSLKKGAAPE